MLVPDESIPTNPSTPPRLNCSLFLFSDSLSVHSKTIHAIDWLIQILELDKLEGRHWHIRPCSAGPTLGARFCFSCAVFAVTGEGLEAGVGWMVDDIQSRIYMY